VVRASGRFISIRHVNASGRSVIWWMGKSGLAALDRDVVGTVAIAQADAALAGAARRDGFGLLLEGEAWKAELEPGHALRTEGFEALRWVRAGVRHEPEAWSAGACEDFVEAYVDAQVARRATLLVTPGHDARGRDVELAEMAADHVRAKALRVAGELYASIRVRAELLDVAALVEAYRSVDVDGFVVWAVGLGGGVERLLALVDGLGGATGKPVVVAGAGPFWQLALGRGAAGAVHGVGDAIYHGAILGTAEDEVTLRRLFMLRNCACGAHDASTPPRGAAEIRAHNLWWAMKEARWACLPDAGRAMFTLALRAAAAKTNRERLGLAALEPGWRVLVDTDEERAEDDAGA
jgi:hypothetical protein